MTVVRWRATYVIGALCSATSSRCEVPSEISVSSHSALEDPQQRSCRTCLERGVTELWSLIIASDANPALPQLSGRACIPGRDVVTGGREATEWGGCARRKMSSIGVVWSLTLPCALLAPSCWRGRRARAVARGITGEGAGRPWQSVRVHLPAGQCSGCWQPHFETQLRSYKWNNRFVKCCLD